MCQHRTVTITIYCNFGSSPSSSCCKRCSALHKHNTNSTLVRACTCSNVSVPSRALQPAAAAAAAHTAAAAVQAQLGCAVSESSPRTSPSVSRYTLLH
eukprot:1351-Heterococcus_DN1.PRE.3